MKLEETLKKETEKWLLKIEKEIKGVKPADKQGGEFLENIQAYIKDSRFFLANKDLVRSFEAVLWAWAVYDTALKVRLLKPGKPKGD